MPMIKIKFAEMSNVIHMDEKWFYIRYDGHKFYVVEGEELPYRSCQSKRYITKVMFMSAVSRPIYSETGELLFDGKIGMFPFIKQQPTERASRNRPRGTLETKPIDSITKQVTRQCIIEQVIPAIKSKWPEGARHYSPYNKKKVAKSVDELVNSVMQAFVDYDAYKLNKVFLTLQCVMIEIMKATAHNDFAIPHMSKDHLATLGLLPRNLEVNEDLVRECIGYLQGIGQTKGLEYLMGELGLMLEQISNLENLSTE
ncbi:uncharacterized protein LOC141587546 [Silene latifolia]|uniref:uncharacterized protein LOC141587546 n=1 Tax=Silene latifolia TaxID=37657 RepID=UPI003D76D4A1